MASGKYRCWSGYFALLCPYRPGAHNIGWNNKISLIMEQLNRIELRGNVGNVRISNVGNSQVARFSLATNFMYKSKDGEGVVETTWHNIVAWSGKNMPDFSRIGKGTPVYVCGRLRSSKYTAGDGTERQIYEVIANKMSIEEDGQ